MVSRRRFRPTPQRKMVWARTQANTVPPPTGTAVDLLAPFRNDGGTSLGATITRVHLTLNCLWNEWNVSSGANKLMVGVIIDQLNQAQTEVPRPGVEVHADWMHWSHRPVVPEYSALTGPVGTTANTRVLSTYVIDIKSQRKCEELGETCWLVLDPAFVGATTLTVDWSASVLLKLP